MAIKHSSYPDKRNYTNLTPNELKQLIRNARENHLATLDLSRSNLRDLPDELWTLSGLQFLNLGNQSSPLDDILGSPNYITQIPRAIEGLTALQLLDLSYLKIDTVSGESPLNLPNLNLLNLIDSAFSHLPNAFLIPSLIYLDLSFSRHLRTLPDRISDLQNLKSLDLRYSGIESFPPLYPQAHQALSAGHP